MSLLVVPVLSSRRGSPVAYTHLASQVSHVNEVTDQATFAARQWRNKHDTGIQNDPAVSFFRAATQELRFTRT